MLKIDFEGYRRGKDHEYLSRYGSRLTRSGWELYCERLEKRYICP